MKVVLALVLAGGVLAGQPGQGPAPDFDIIIRHGSVVDGTGRARFAADVGILGDRIASVGDLSARRGAIDIDAAGQFVSPGFINIHSHAARDALPTAVNMLTQGVTTEILNPDGGGPTDIERELSELAAGGLAVNIGAYVPFNGIWAAVVGPANRRPAAGDIERMRDLVQQNLSRGGWGVSAGLDYKPAYFATTDEVVSVVSAAAKWRTDFPNHDRLTPEGGYSSRAGIAETIAIGERAGLMPVVTHMKVQGREQGRAAEALAMVRNAGGTGHPAAADAYPYLAGQTSLDALIVPAWAQDGGREAMLRRFADPSLRAKIVREAEEAMDARFNGAAGVFLPATGRQLVDVMREMRAGAGETVLRLVEQQPTSAILRFGAEDDLVKILQAPATSIACDCGASLQTRTHPRFYGTFPRVLGHYVRETGALAWEDAVRKMTGLPAATIGLVDRGLLAAGMAADITIFDPATVIDHATYEDPARPSDGIGTVIVNGRLELRDGRPTGEGAGRVLARAAHMPSRPMTPDRPVRVEFRGSLGSARLAIDLAQKPGARAASGSFRLTDTRANVLMSMAEPGVLQAADGWVSLTGRVRVAPDGGEQAATVIIDRANPLAPDRGAAIVVQTSGGYRLDGTVAPAQVRITR
jgi:N-acyl-D-amino-acid deacylase